MKLPKKENTKSLPEITHESNNQAKPLASLDPSKKNKELYVLNLPSILIESEVKELLNAALISNEANDTIGDPLIEVIKKRGTNYFLLYFRTENECEKALKQLNGMKILNRSLYVDRSYNPKDNEKTEINEENNKFSKLKNLSFPSKDDLFPLLKTFEKEADYKIIIEKEKEKEKEKMKNNGFINNNNEKVKNNKFLFDDNDVNKIKEENKLFVFNLPLYFKEKDILKLFESFGKIKNIEIIKEGKNNLFSGKCLLEYKDKKSSIKALNYGTNIKLGRNYIFIEPANSNKNRNNKKCSSFNRNQASGCHF